jgi:ribosomal protein S18 acetylase RimI-like enzyme
MALSYVIKVLAESEKKLAAELEAQVAGESGLQKFVPVPDEVRSEASSGGRIMGAFVDGLLVAQCLGYQNENFFDLYKKRLPNEIDFDFDSSVVFVFLVADAFRRNGLAKTLLGECIQRCKSLGYKSGLATVAPDNVPSIKVLLDCGFRIHYTGPFFADNIRLALHKHL